MRLIRCLAPLALGLMMLAAPPARALDAVSVRGDAPAIDLTAILDHQRSETDRIQVSTAPGADSVVRRIEVRARTSMRRTMPSGPGAVETWMRSASLR